MKWYHKPLAVICSILVCAAIVLLFATWGQAEWITINEEKGEIEIKHEIEIDSLINETYRVRTTLISRNNTITTKNTQTDEIRKYGKSISWGWWLYEDDEMRWPTTQWIDIGVSFDGLTERLGQRRHEAEVAKTIILQRWREMAAKESTRDKIERKMQQKLDEFMKEVK